MNESKEKIKTKLFSGIIWMVVALTLIIFSACMEEKNYDMVNIGGYSIKTTDPYGVYVMAVVIIVSIGIFGCALARTIIYGMKISELARVESVKAAKRYIRLVPEDDEEGEKTN